MISRYLEFLERCLDEDEAIAREASGAHILAEVAAKRELLARHLTYYGDGDDSHWPVPVIRLLAEAYRERPGFPAPPARQT